MIWSALAPTAFAQTVGQPQADAPAIAQSPPATAHPAPIPSPVPPALEKAYAEKLEALTLNWKTLENAIWISGWVGIVVIGLAAIFAVMGYKSLKEVSTDAKNAATAEVDKSFRDKSGIVGDLIEEAKKANVVVSQLEEIKSQLSKYVLLNETIHSATSFDPMIDYRPLRYEIEHRRAKLIEMITINPNTSPEETTLNPEFAARAAAIFERLLKAAKEDASKGTQRLSTVDLFNIAASASEADLDFASIEFMEIAAKQDKSLAPEIEARLIRQRLAASRIDRAEAKIAIGKVLTRVNGFDLNLVVSETFNIGLHSANPVSIATTIDKNLPEQLNTISYPLFVRAQLLFMGDKIDDWKQADALALAGIAALRSEAVEARWYDSSLKELRKLIRDQRKRTPAPDWLDEANKVLAERTDHAQESALLDMLLQFKAQATKAQQEADKAGSQVSFLKPD